ncbi:OLC1v1012073C1 [Oldenlandia corymbosa var. corymbosa]|uniref:OLC1v1012073C1 n=1 Tax=Oldenlandia corymbosa var. corymbosa TaxID=529605 RepID=A0AAV1DV55_OLDCO|nr:OLC1v1012073C1 [Oldenlandia corymbosa var. corymbosa]
MAVAVLLASSLFFHTASLTAKAQDRNPCCDKCEILYQSCDRNCLNDSGSSNSSCTLSCATTFGRLCTERCGGGCQVALKGPSPCAFTARKSSSRVTGIWDVRFINAVGSCGGVKKGSSPCCDNGEKPFQSCNQGCLQKTPAVHRWAVLAKVKAMCKPEMRWL